MTFWYSQLKTFAPIFFPFFRHTSFRNSMELQICATKARRITRASVKVSEELPEDRPGPKRSRRSRAQISSQSHDKDGEAGYFRCLSPSHSPRTEELRECSEEAPSQKPKKARKKKDVDPQPVLPRLNSPWKVGAHVSSSGGVENAVTNAAAIGYVLYFDPICTFV